MKNKILIFLLILVILAIYPVWRYSSNATLFANAVLSHVSPIGKWTHSSIHSSFDGTITLRNLTFTPNGYAQGFEIDSVKISAEPMFLLKTGSQELEYMLPEVLSISINSIIFNGTGTDIEEMLETESMWMLIAGYAGSFGCSRGSYESFDDSTWDNIFSEDQIFNVDLYYSRQQNGSLDVDLVLDAENQFSSTWSSNLKSSYTDKQIVLNELIVDKLYYSYLDNGFNLSRNNACKENYNSSFTAYRLSSAQHVQKYLRTYFLKELPSVLISLYQRLLIPDVEFNTIITLNERKYLNEIYKIKQRELFETSVVEISTKQGEYLPITLTEIDYKGIDSDVLKRENLAREKWEAQKKLQIEQTITAKDILKPKIFTTGKKQTRMVSLNNLHSVTNKKVRLKTTRGRPITGYLRNIVDGIITIETKYKTGTAVLSVESSKVASVELMK